MSKSSILYDFMKGPGFAPDLDRRTPNIIVDGQFSPTVYGMEAPEASTNTSYTALASTPTGAYCAELLDGSIRLFAGDNKALYEARTSTGWTDVSRTTGGTYVGTSKWVFSQLGNVTLAANSGQTLQASAAASTPFADVTSAGDFAVVETVGQFVFGARTSATPDAIWWSALGDYTSWTQSVTTQAGKKRITSKPGPIIAIKALGDYIVVYKKNGIYVGRYVGPPDVWSFEEIPAEVGASSLFGVCNIGYAHFFMDRELSDVWMFDGSRPVRLNCPAIKWFVDSAGGTVNKTTPGQSYALHNKAKDSIWFAGRGTYLLSLTSYTILIYNYKTNQWGFNFDSNCIFFQYCSSSDVDRIGRIDFSTLKPSVYTSNLNGGALKSGDIGDGENIYCVKTIAPLWKTKPTVDSVILYTKMNADDSGYSTGIYATSNGQGAYDILLASMWHRISISWNGVTAGGSLAGIQVSYDVDGTE